MTPMNKTKAKDVPWKKRKHFLRHVNGKQIATSEDKRATALSFEKTVVVISDAQVPWQDNEALDLALLVAKKCSPTRLIALGDIWDVSGAAFWKKNPFIPLLFNQERRLARAVYEIWDQEFPHIEKDALAGNHEERIAWAIKSLPERFRWIAQVAEIDWASLLGLGCETTMAPVWELDTPQDKILDLYREWQAAGSGELEAVDILHMVNKLVMTIRQLKPKRFPALHWRVWRREPAVYELPFEAWPSQHLLTVGKLAFLHGHEIRMNSLAVHVAVNVLRKTKENVCIGHWHRIGPTIDRNIHGQEIGAFLNPCLCRLDQYAFRPAWQQGISVIDFTHSGHFCVQPVMFMRDQEIGLFGMLGRNIFKLSDAPVRHRKLPPLGMLTQMVPLPKPEEML